MKNVFTVSKKSIHRRAFLKASGVCLGLPWLDAMMPAFAASRAGEPPRRMLNICTNMGMIPRYWFPEGKGTDYKASDYLKELEPHRKDFTVFSGVSHPQVDGGHHAEISFLTAAPHPGQSGFRNTISLDQYVAERVGDQTRSLFGASGGCGRQGGDFLDSRWRDDSAGASSLGGVQEVVCARFGVEIAPQMNQLHIGRRHSGCRLRRCERFDETVGHSRSTQGGSIF